jgi:polar amino acid transport system substrate-binding protein
VTGRRARVAAVALAALAAALAGCGGTSDRALRSSLRALHVQPPPSSTSSCRTASLSQTGSTPAAGLVSAIRARGKLIAGVDQNTLLLSYLNPANGQFEGFEIDLLREIAKAIFGSPRAIEFKAYTTDQRISGVQDGSVDLAASAITITPARRRCVDFSTVYYSAGQRVLVPSDSTVQGLSDLRGKPVCATETSTSLYNLIHSPFHPVPVPVPQRTDCLVLLQQGKVDAISSDDILLLGLHAQDPYTKIVGPRFSDEPYGIAVNKAHPDFVRFVDGVLAQMRADGTLALLARRWLSGSSATPAPSAAG